MKHIAIIVASLIVALSVIGARLMPRYEISGSLDASGNPIAWRVNSATGDVQICMLARSENPFEKFAPDNGKQFDITCRHSFGGVAPKS
jgi:hypothetical protein